MNTFRVWAIFPKEIELQLGDKKIPMTRGENDWWIAKTSANPGDNYGFVLDGEGPFPDPRSPFQPDGVNGLSQLVDQSAFKWTDANWQAPPLANAVIYELHVGTFTPQGTFDAAIGKLKHLIELGVTHVELMPVNEFSGARGWGYDGVDLFAPHHAYGGPDGLKRLINACHAHGLAVILDVVYNHLGPSGNYLEKFAPYFTEKYSSPWGKAVNFDSAGSDEVRRFFCDNALMWLRDYHFDGLRLDAVHAILDTSAVPFLEQLSIEVKRLSAGLKRNLVLIPESDLNDPRLLWPHEHGGFALDAQWSDDFHHALHTILTGETNGYYEDFGKISQLNKALHQAFVYDGIFSRHRRRHHGRFPENLSGHRFLAYLQNHDQIGNRAKGERSSQLMSVRKLKIAAALVLTSPFIPMLFQGEEWAASTPFLYFTNHQDAELGKAVREGRRREFAAFGWKPEEIPDPQASETFEKSKLNWSEIFQAQHSEMLDWHKKLIQLRRAEKCLSDGGLDKVKTKFDENARWLWLERGEIYVVCNFSNQPNGIQFSSARRNVLLASDKNFQLTEASIRLAPESVAILKNVKQ